MFGHPVFGDKLGSTQTASYISQEFRGDDFRQNVPASLLANLNILPQVLETSIQVFEAFLNNTRGLRALHLGQAGLTETGDLLHSPLR